MKRRGDLYEHDARGSLEVYWCFPGPQRPQGHWYAKVCDFETPAVAGEKFDDFATALGWAREQQSAQRKEAA